MTSARVCFCLLLLGAQNAMPQKPTAESCAEDGDVRLISVVSDSPNNTIQGKIQICEDSVWKNVCDDDWTVEDATVVCRDLGYTDLNAATYLPNVVLPVYSRSKYACNGSEAKLVQCSKVHITECNSIVGVQCYNFTVTTPTTLSLQPSSTSYQTPVTTALHVTQTPLLQATVPTKNSSPSLPVYVYAIIGTVALLIVVVCIVVVLIIHTSARRKRLISPQSHKNGDIPPEEALYCDLNESKIITKPHETIAQHHVYHEVAAPSVPVYEDIDLKDSVIPKPQPYDRGGDCASQGNRDTQYTTPGPHLRRQGASNRENPARHQHGSCSHKKPPPITEKTCTPYAVNPLAFQKSPTEKEFDPPTPSTTSSLGEQHGQHDYAILEDPTGQRPTVSARHNSLNPVEGELVGGHHYAILERHNTQP